MKHPSKIRVIEPLIWFLVITVGIFYSINALNTGDWFWFSSRSAEFEPQRIVLSENGQRRTMVPGNPDFAALAEAAELSLGNPSNTDLINLGISEETALYYEDNGVLLEIYFDAPVQFHTNFRAGEPTQLLVPVSGRHAGNGYFFRGGSGEWWFGAMRMGDPQPLLDTVAGMGYAVDYGPALSN